MMKRKNKIIFITFLIAMTFILSSCLRDNRDCAKFSCYTVTSIIRKSKHGRVGIIWDNGYKDSMRWRRPNNSDIGTRRCECVEWKK